MVVLLMITIQTAAQDAEYSIPQITSTMKQAAALQSMMPDSAKKLYESVIINISPFLNEISDPFTDQRAWDIYGKALMGVGECYFNLGDYPSSLSKYFESYSIFEATGNLENLAYAYIGLGRVYRYYGPSTFQNAINYYHTADSLFTVIGDNEGIALASYKTGVLYADIISKETYDAEKAIRYLEKALMIQTGLNAEEEVANIKCAMANIYSMQGRFASAIDFINDVLKYYHNNYSPKGLYNANRIAGGIFLKIKVYPKALEHSKKALEIAEKMNFVDGQNNAAEQISEIYYAMKRYDLAYNYYHYSVEKKFELLSSEKIRTIEEMKTKYETQEKEDLIRLKQEEIEHNLLQKKYLVAGIILAIFLTLLFFIFYRLKVRVNRIIKQQNAEIKQKKKELMIQADGLQKLNATKDKFFGIIAHDLRNPFMHLLGFSKMLASNAGEYSPDEIKKIADLMYKSSMLTFNLLENLLLWANSQKGNIQFNPVTEPINQIIENEISLIHELASKKEITIINHIPQGFVVHADLQMIKAVVRNLLSNAVKYTPRNGKIELTGHKKDNMLEISVIDNGIGIEKELLVKLCCSEIIESEKGTENEQGSGLGLVLCREFIEKNGGQLKIESEQGKGSKFTFTLPDALSFN